MIIIQLFGGLGNQLFQYALGRRLSLEHHTELKLDVGLLNQKSNNITYRKYELDRFNIEAAMAKKEEVAGLRQEQLSGIYRSFCCRMQTLKSFNKRRIIKEPSFTFNKDVLNCSKNVYLEGYWQSYLYFEAIRNELLQDITPIEPLSPTEHAYLEQVSKENSVSVHIRRGDYISNPHNKKIYVEISSSYYEAAQLYVNGKFDDMRLFIFSDDIDWVKENLEFPTETVYVDIHDAVKSLFLMSKCQHNITSNSTFSWWGAWLNTNPDKIVITPKEWFHTGSNLKTDDLLPEGWVKM